MPRKGLTTESVVAEAIVLVDATGFAELSLSSLAQRLGVRVPSLYKHIDGIDDLRQRICHQSRDEIYAVIEAAGAGSHGTTAFRAVATAYRNYAIEFRGRFDAAGYRARLNPALKVGGTLERIAEECGVPADHAMRVVQALRASLRGLLALQVDTTPELSGSVFDSLLDLLEAGLVNFESHTLGSQLSG